MLKIGVGGYDMKFELFGFNQEKAVEYNLTVEDLLLIDYVWDMIASPTMQHIVDNGIPYVWLQHDRILADLPILNISNRSLINYLNKLKDLDLLAVKTVHNDGARGSKSYYAITEKCEELRYDQVQNFAVSQRPGAKNCSSDNIRDTNISNNTIKQLSLFNTNNKEVINKEDTYSEKIKWFVDNFNSICVSLPKCVRMSGKRGKGIINIVKKFSSEEILEVFTKLEESDFCSGRSGKWRADIDFILREDKFISVLEGKYDNKKKRCDVEAITPGDKFRVSSEEKEEMRRAVERGELKEY